MVGLVGLVVLIAAATANAESLSVRFKMPSDNGYRISFEGEGHGERGDASFTASKKSRADYSSATYFLTHGASVSGTHVEASLGLRGAVSVDFHEKSARRVSDPFCEGYQLVRKGTFEGKFEFSGEHGFAESSGKRAKGTVAIDHTRKCGGGSIGGHGGSKSDLFGLATCSSDPDLSYFAIGGGDEVEPTFHFATMVDLSPRVSIFRGAFTSGDAGTFDVAHNGRSAKVSPSTPFAGTGNYGSHRLTGDLTVAFPGVEMPVALTPSKAALKRAKGGSFSSRCGGGFAVGTGRRENTRRLPVLDSGARAGREGGAGYRHIAERLVDRAQHVVG